MRIKIITDEQSNELSLSIPGELPGLSWGSAINADSTNQVCIDLAFDDSPGRIAELEKAYPGLIAVNSVTNTLSELPSRFFRFNGWKGFLKGPIIEAAASDNNKAVAEKSFGLLGKKIEWVPDEPGFISARIVSMIINEAYFALDEKLSSKNEIDTAMKLGTNYPLGPFDWSKQIGLEKIYALLKKLSVTNKRYSPAPLLEKEVIA